MRKRYEFLALYGKIDLEMAAGLSEPPLICAVEEGGRFIGYVIYHDADSKEIGWVLKRDAWGKGFAKALTRRLIDRTRAEGKAVVLECAPRQRASRHIAEQAGFSYIGSVERCEVYRLEQGSPRRDARGRESGGSHERI